MRRDDNLSMAGASVDRSEPGSGEASDDALMERIADGDAAAFGALFDRYWTSLVVSAERMLLRRDAAKDIVQEAFVQVWRNRSSWRPTGSVKGYLWRITRNLALNEQRRQRTRKGWAERNAGEDPTSGSLPGPAELFEAEALRAEVEEAVRSLPARRREVFVLARFEGLSYEEIAEAMGISPQTVANQMSAALAALREALSGRLQ